MADKYEIENLDKAIERLNEPLWTKPQEHFFDSAGISVLDEAKRFAPVKENFTRNSLGKGGAGNIWKPGKNSLTVGSNVKHKNFSYPTKLDESDRYHHRDGPRKGQQTKGFFSDAPKRAASALNKAIDTFKRETLAAWLKGAMK